MSDFPLEEIKEFNVKLFEGLHQDNQLQVDPLMVEDVVEYAENSMKWTNHKWDVVLGNETKVTRDGIDFDNIVSVNAVSGNVPKLTIECTFNNFNINLSEDGTQQIFYKGEWLEEVEKYEIVNDPKNNFITHIRFTVIGDVDMHWDFEIDRGERENPNISFPKINYHKEPALTEEVYKQVAGYSPNTKQLEGEDDEWR